MSEVQFVVNFCVQLEMFNLIIFFDIERNFFFMECFVGLNDIVVEKIVCIQEDYVQFLMCDDGLMKNILLIDKKNIYNNWFQVINQYEIEQGEGGVVWLNCYDVIVFVNGLLFIYIELKCWGVDICEVFNQIDCYQCDSFWVGFGFFDYVQFFVISNGMLMKYYLNIICWQYVEDVKGCKWVCKIFNLFEFILWWVDVMNKLIQDFVGFMKMFFVKYILFVILMCYCVLIDDKMLFVMWFYQIVVIEWILQWIEVVMNQCWFG